MKSIIKENMLEKRKYINHIELSKSIFDKLKETDEFKKAKSVMFYLSKPGEVITTEFLKEVDKDIIVPVVEGDDIIPAYLLNQDFEKGMFGINEPKNKLFTKKENIDLVIVPGIAFDEKGNRIGYGKGYYDKFLKDLNVPKIALAYDFQIIDKVDAQKHDIPMDKIITEKRVIKCS